MNKNILICGVGGQGTVLASKLICAAFMAEGEQVHSAETIGMAQRGGAVLSHIRIGEAFSPLVPMNSADVIIAFEPGEAVRNLSYLKKDGTIIVNSRSVTPVTASLQKTGYNGGQMIDFLKKQVKRLIVVDSEEICKEFGSTKFFNIAMLGVAAGAGVFGLKKDTLISCLETGIKPKFIDINKKAFNKGYIIGGSYED